MLSRLVYLENGHTLLKLRVYIGTQNYNNTLWSVKRNFLKISLSWCASQIKRL